ncbi:MAG: hypothetical protein IKL68_06425 [Clostridia bacterium]|nr:hypothetical protein [Clostridia bacterium]
MTYRVNITNLSTITTEYNLNFLKIFNPNYAEKVGTKIISETRTLSLFPHSHPIYKKTNSYVYRKLLINDFFHIIYTVFNNEVVVLYTTDARKEFDEYYYYLN